MKTVFIDRDGVINKRLIDDWVKKWEEFTFLPGVLDAMALLRKNGYRCLLITNQRGLSLGLFSLQELGEIHQQMNRTLVQNGGGFFDDIFVCYHDRHHDCSCRKPQPGLFFQAVEKYPDIDLSNSVMFGDSESDREAASRAGCGRFYLIDREYSLLDRVVEFLQDEVQKGEK